MPQRRAKRYQRQQRRSRTITMGFFTVVAFAVFFLTMWIPAHQNPYPWITMAQSPTLISLFDHTPLPDYNAMLPLSEGEEDTALRSQFEQAIQQFPTTLVPHLYFFDLQTGRYVNIRGDMPVPAASVIKLPVLVYYLQQVDKGEMTLDTPLLYRFFHQAEGSGDLQYSPLNQELPSREVARKMMQISDNSCTNMLIYYFGGMEPINEALRNWGLSRTHISNWLPDLGGTNLITMHDMATLLYNLDEGPMLSVESRVVARNILTHVHNRSLLRSMVPDNVELAHKTGNIGGSVGDSGIFTLPDGRKYILTVQVERPYNNSEAIELIRQVSKLSYENMTGTTVPTSIATR